MTETYRASKVVRGTLYLIGGAAVAVPLAACQPEPAPAPKKEMEKPATRVSVSEEGGVKTIVKEVIVEKVVYVEKPAASGGAGVAEDEVLATLGVGKDERKITFSQIKPLLMDAYGLSILRRYTELDMVKYAAKQRNITIEKKDIEAESDKWLKQMAPDAEKNEYPRLLASLLQRQRLSRAEYDLVMEINAYFRKIAQVQMAAPPGEETLREAFNLMYGEKVQCRHIACNNIGEWTEAKKLVDGGTPFEEVARLKSRNGLTGPLGGELPPFTRTAKDVPDAMRDAAFALKEGEVSADVIQADGKFHVLKLDTKIPVKAVKFEDVKASVEQELRMKTEDAFILEYRRSLGAQAVGSMKVVEPEMKKQWDAAKRQAEEEKAKAATVAPGTAPR